MKQKDKKIHTRYTGRLKNINLPDIDVLDDAKESAHYKTARTHSKSSVSFKNGMNLLNGRVMEVMSNNHCRVLLPQGMVLASISGRLKQFLYQTRIMVTVGDYVEVDSSSEDNYRIEHIQTRKNNLIRYGGGSFQKEIILAANIDQLIITSSWRMPIFKPGLVDRYLILAAKHNINPILVINKIDLCEDREELEEATQYYRQHCCQVIYTSVVSGEGMATLKATLQGKDSVFSGHSGAGKSSLINHLEPGINLITAEVSDYNEKGKHTTTQAILIPWSFGGHLLDTPGIKTVNLHHDDIYEIPKLFPGFQKFYPLCKFNDCTHTHESDCAVLAALEEGSIDPDRYESYTGIMASL